MFGMLPGIPAIVLGFLAHRGTRATVAPVPGAGAAKAGIVLGSIGTVIAAVVFVPFSYALREAQESACRGACRNNLKDIAVSLRTYAQDNGGAFPEKLSALYPRYVSDLGVFVCPSSGNEPGPPARIDEWCEYTYSPGLHPTGTPADADVLLCYDSQYRHIPSGRNVLYLDGHAQFRKQSERAYPPGP
jgi:prepilin-type processing-associated H-X9-DG protein